MVKEILLDFSRVLLFPTNEKYAGGLNDLYRKIIKEPNYVYFEHFRLNEELLDFLKSLKDRYPLSIFTSEIIQDDKAVKPILEAIFTHIFSAKELGVMKTQKAAYLKLADQLHEKPENILYIDDKSVNLRGASDAGFKTMHYLSNSQIIADLQRAIH